MNVYCNGGFLGSCTSLETAMECIHQTTAGQIQAGPLTFIREDGKFDQYTILDSHNF